MNKNVLTVLVGSHAYGTALPTSDRDELRVHFAPVEHYLGMKKAKSSQKLVDGEDVQDYEFRHFVSLCLQFNPNVVPALWVREDCLLDYSEVGARLVHNRELFSSKKAYHTLCGYAHSQRSRMLGEATGQMGEKRKELKEKFGYDTKYAYHTLRLLRMCHEFLNTGVLNVFREDGAELYRVRNGEFSLETVEGMVEVEKAKCGEAFSSSKLPEEPDYEAVEKFVMKSLFAHVHAKMEKEYVSCRQ